MIQLTKPIFYILTGLIVSSAARSHPNHFAADLFSDTTKRWTLPPLPKTLSFAEENVPFEKQDVKEYFDRNYTQIYYQTGNLMNLMKQSARWFPLIEERLKAKGIPEDFKYVCVAESTLQNLISKVGATGFWQFMSYTAPGYGLQMNSSVDERYNVLKATDAACIYFKTAFDKFGTWTAAAASFNCGMGRYNEQATFQQTKNYYDLYLPEETNNYIHRILSFKYIFENAKALGFDIEAERLFAPYKTKTLQVNSSINNLAQFALDNGTTYKVLRILNPWLKGRSLITGGKTYDILLPVQ